MSRILHECMRSIASAATDYYHPSDAEYVSWLAIWSYHHSYLV
jgi:hypothetical protein